MPSSSGHLRVRCADSSDALNLHDGGPEHRDRAASRSTELILGTRPEHVGVPLFLLCPHPCATGHSHGGRVVVGQRGVLVPWAVTHRSGDPRPPTVDQQPAAVGREVRHPPPGPGDGPLQCVRGRTVVQRRWDVPPSEHVPCGHDEGRLNARGRVRSYPDLADECAVVLDEGGRQD